ncbi:hypothetical protein ACP70R_015003 [Stipagrostis hirtigluma subsp. patula]
MVHFIVTSLDRIVVVDVQGKIRRVIPLPEKERSIAHIAQSQGHLHYMNLEVDAEQGGELFIWVLEDYNTEWALKHIVNTVDVFGWKSDANYCLITIHPECNILFFFHEGELISYNMDRKEVSVIGTYSNSCFNIVPYVPYFTKSPALTNKS